MGHPYPAIPIAVFVIIRRCLIDGRYAVFAPQFTICEKMVYNTALLLRRTDTRYQWTATIEPPVEICSGRMFKDPCWVAITVMHHIS